MLSATIVASAMPAIAQWVGLIVPPLRNAEGVAHAEHGKAQADDRDDEAR